MTIIPRDELPERFAEWQDWLSGDDPNSIYNQLSKIYRCYLGFRIFQFSTEKADVSIKKGILHNSILYFLILDGYFTYMAAAIRRLTDTNVNNPPKNPNKRVCSIISLYRLTQCVKSVLNDLTRERIFTLRNVEYNESEYWYVSDHASVIKIDQNRKLHSDWDILCGVEPDERTRCDLMKLEIFANIEASFAECKDICVFVDKFIAHAATESSRTPKSCVDILPESDAVTIGSITKAAESLFRAYGIFTKILGSRFSPIHNYGTDGYFVCLDQEIIPKSLRNGASNDLDEAYNEVLSWTI